MQNKHTLSEINTQNFKNGNFVIMRRLATNKRILLLIFGIFIAGVILLCQFIFLKPTHRLKPSQGQLDLQSWDQSRDEALSLSGNWDFYWNRFLTYQDLSKSNPEPDLKVDVPQVWNNYKLRGENLPGFGYATYRLKVVGVPKGIPLAMRLQTLSTAYQLYINDQLMASNGMIGATKEQFAPEYQPRIVEFTPTGTGFELIILVANFIYARGGMWYAIDFGTPEQIRNMDRRIVNKDLFLLGALAVMALYYLNIFLLRREDKSSLYFVFMCVMFVSRTLIYGDYLIYRLVPFISFPAIISIEYITVCWFTIFAVLMVRELFPEETSGTVLKSFLVYGSVMAVIYIFTHIAFYTRLVYLLQITSIGMGLYAIFCVCIAFIKGKKDALLVLVGAIMVIIAAAHDMLYQNNQILSNYGELVPIGLFMLLFMQSFVLARRFSGAFRDVESLSQKLLKLDKVKDEFLANTSHELRTPLSGVLGITEAMLQGSGGDLCSEQRQNLGIIAASCRRLANLVNDILDYSKLKHGDIRLNIKPIRVDGLMQTVVKVFQQLNKAKDFEVIIELSGTMPPVMADENRLVQILYNLIGNATKFTIKGYVKVSAKVTGAMIEVCVSDTGEGIPADKLADIFKSFEQVDTSLTRKHGGTGLGLSITKQLVELEGGRIWVQSTPGSGSEFYFTLPIADNSSVEQELEMALPEIAVAAHEEEPIQQSQNVAGGRTILLVDDDRVNLQSATAILKIGGYPVTAVNSGEAALARINRYHDYSLVILDVMMPVMSGYEVCRRIREKLTLFELPVLMLTAKTNVADIVMGFEAGANDYLAKPFEPQELTARVRTLVNLKRSINQTIAAELAFMQAQIRPHFLYNTLNTISSFCDTAPERARSLIDEFSNYLRQSFDFKNPEMYVTLANEISLIKSYVEIEKARFGDKLKVGFEVTETGTKKIPSLSIQPLVENAIRHGIRKKGGGGTVTVSVKNTAEGLLIAVTDDGLGIPKDKLVKLLKNDAGRGVGLWNIDTRLKKLFGRGLVIESEPGKGTRVMFLIPPEVSLN